MLSFYIEKASRIKVLLIYPDIRIDFPLYSGQYNEGIAYLSSVLKQAGHKVSLFHIIQPIKESHFCQRVAEECPDLIGFSTITNMFSYVTQWALWLHRHFPAIPTICGGSHPTVVPEDTIRAKGIDMICIGEGEQTIVELCETLRERREITNIRSLWIKKNSEIIRNMIRPLVTNLDSLPDPDRDIFDFKNLMSSREAIGFFSASRGCPYNCTYCCNHVIKAAYPNPHSYVRFRSVARVINEIKTTLTKYDFIHHIGFNDDIMGIRIDWLHEFAEKYRRDIRVPFVCNSRIELINMEYVSIMKEAGCTTLYIGIESGNEEIRMGLLGRKMTNKQIIEAFALCQEAGIQTRTFNMVGLPFEDMRKILETIKLNAKLCPVSVMPHIFYPYPGSRLYDICVENGFITRRRFDSYEEGTILSQPTISEQEVLFAYRYFRLFFKVYSFVYKLPMVLARHSETFLDWVFCSSLLPHSLLTKLYLGIYRGLRYLYLKVVVRFYNRTSYLYTCKMEYNKKKVAETRAGR